MVFEFDEICEEIGIERYLKPAEISFLGRPGYNRVDLLKTALFGAMDKTLASLRELEDACKVNLRYRHLMKNETPSYRTFGYFIAEELSESIGDIFKAVMGYICEKDHVDLQHL